MSSEISHCQIIDLFLLLTPRRRRFRVTGSSMSPLLVNGEEVIVITHSQVIDNLQANDIVVLHHPLQLDLLIIKRVRNIIINEHRKQYFVQGDNLDASTDSRHFGLVDENLLIGKVICRLP